MKTQERKDKTMDVSTIREIAAELLPNAVETRITLHRQPELRWEEEQTYRFIEENLEKSKWLNLQHGRFDLVFQIHKARGGIWVDVTSKTQQDRKRILLRADMDALPVTEKTGLDFVSTSPGVMHACGHDIHMAGLLTVFRAICLGKIEPKHNLRFVFDRAEERPGETEPKESGIQSLIQDGVLEGVSEAYAPHVGGTQEKNGVFYYRPGIFLGNSDRLRVTIHCRGGHTARPHLGVSAIDIAHDIISGLKDFAPKTLGPLAPAIVKCTQISSGTSGNILPEEARMTFGVRTLLNAEERKKFFTDLEIAIIGIAKGRYKEVSVEFEQIYGHPVLVNDTQCTARLVDVLRATGETCEEHEIIMGGESFAHILNRVPGCHFMVGAHQQGSGELHSPTFNPDEQVLAKFILVHLLLATQ